MRPWTSTRTDQATRRWLPPCARFFARIPTRPLWCSADISSPRARRSSTRSATRGRQTHRAESSRRWCYRANLPTKQLEPRWFARAARLFELKYKSGVASPEWLIRMHPSRPRWSARSSRRSSRSACHPPCAECSTRTACARSTFSDGCSIDYGANAMYCGANRPAGSSQPSLFALSSIDGHVLWSHSVGWIRTRPTAGTDGR